MRRMNIPVDAQIRGIEKALANPRTPKQFKGPMMKRLMELKQYGR